MCVGEHILNHANVSNFEDFLTPTISVKLQFSNKKKLMKRGKL